MTKKQRRRKTEYIKGYRRGYQKRGLTLSAYHDKNEDYKRGYREGRKDYREDEPALY